ncbi:DsbA family oxidoreductase [Saccharomonospora iraqiensis]|uniref:DsbA family oxidoreductase n=1 Tax=Saccharomonospora iraqiensis TaxID=52698 RepID=UPI00022E1570|nr:DsbA family protein [Saccharomonospora iraqiensis]
MPEHTTLTDRPAPHVALTLDIACVWSYLGYARFARAAARHRAVGRTIEVTFRPFQVAPHASTAGEPLTEVHHRDLGPDAADKVAHVRALFDADGTEIHFDRAVFTNTFDAHRLIAVAAHQGRAEDMVTSLFHAYFVDGHNIADTHTLRNLAAETGVAWSDDGTDVIHSELQRNRDDNITTVPRFSVENGPVLLGAQSEDALFAALETVAPPLETDGTADSR